MRDSKIALFRKLRRQKRFKIRFFQKFKIVFFQKLINLKMKNSLFFESREIQKFRKLEKSKNQNSIIFQNFGSWKIPNSLLFESRESKNSLQNIIKTVLSKRNLKPKPIFSAPRLILTRNQKKSGNSWFFLHNIIIWSKFHSHESSYTKHFTFTQNFLHHKNFILLWHYPFFLFSKTFIKVERNIKKIEKLYNHARERGHSI